MKYLIFLALLVACGKHDMPKEQDLNDSDGDQVVNELDVDKHIANIVPLNEIEAELNFKTGTSTLEDHKLELTNKVDLQNFSKDLLVKNLQTLKLNGFFSEYSVLRIKSNKKIPVLEDGLISLKLRFPKSESSGILYLVEAEQRTKLGDWTDNMDFEISSTKLNDILTGKAYLSINTLNERTKFQVQTQEESINEKTYRVLMNDGVKTKVYYVSKELDFKGVLEKLKIKKYKLIDEVNLLTTSIKPVLPEWWVRNINNRDIVIIKENLRELSDHYLLGFEKTKYTVLRKNGVASQPLIINKNKAAKILLKMRGTRTEVSFSQTKDSESGVSGGRDNQERWHCKYFYNTPSVEVKSEIESFELFRELDFNNDSFGYLLAFSDEKGPFWEFKVSDDSEMVQLNLQNLPDSAYVQEGLFDSKCENKPEPKIKPNLHTSERSLNIEIEAFVEKI